MVEFVIVDIFKCALVGSVKMRVFWKPKSLFREMSFQMMPDR